MREALVLILILVCPSAYAHIIPRGEAFTCTPTHVWDGDGPIWCQEGPKVRLSGIAARDGLVSLIGDPYGVGQHGHILVRGPAMNCLSDDGAGGSRTAAWCVTTQGLDVNCAMVANGWALVWPKYWRGHVCE